MNHAAHLQTPILLDVPTKITCSNECPWLQKYWVVDLIFRSYLIEDSEPLEDLRKVGRGLSPFGAGNMQIPMQIYL